MDISPAAIIGLDLAVILFVLLLWGIKQPLAWIVASVLAIAAGVGCAGYGITQALLTQGTNESLAGVGRTSSDLRDISIFVGGGLGSTVAGIVLLVVSLFRSRKSPVAKA